MLAGRSVALAVAPTHGIFRGQSAVYRASEGSESLIRPAAYSVVKFAQLGWDKLKIKLTYYHFYMAFLWSLWRGSGFYLVSFEWLFGSWKTAVF